MPEQTFSGSNINLVKYHNQQAILLSLLYETELSRVQLASKTHLSNTTITNLVSELLDQNILSEEGTLNSKHGHRRVGRPRTALRIVPNARFAIGVHIGVGLLRVAVVNLFAEIITNKIESFSLDTPAENVLGQIQHIIEETIEQSGVDHSLILGVGVGASGLVNCKTGVNILAPNLGWHWVPIQNYLQSALDLPVIVDNNVRAMALGEAYFGAGRDADSLAFVYGRVGVGAGFVTGGNLYHGSGTGAGEIGHMIMVPKDGEQCRCGNRGCLETLVSESVLVHKAQDLAIAHPESHLSKLLQERPADRPASNSAAQVFEAARQGDELAQDLVRETACYLGIALANLVNVINPELIILGGMFAEGQDLIIPTAGQTMREMAFAGMGEKVRLSTTGFGWRAGVIGASALALMRFFYQQNQIFA